MLVENDNSSLKNCFVGSCFRQARIIVVVKVKVFVACRGQQMFWLVAKVNIVVV